MSMLARIAPSLLIALLAAGGVACDPADGLKPADDVTFRDGSGYSGRTLNTSNWVSAPARDIYEFSRLGEAHETDFGGATHLIDIRYPHSMYGEINTDPRAQVLPGQFEIKIRNLDEFQVRVIPPAPLPKDDLSGAELVGLELTFASVYNYGLFPTTVRVSGYAEDASGEPLFELERETSAGYVPVCEPDGDGERLAALYGNVQINAITGAISAADDIIHIACTAGAPGKAARYGYRPSDGHAIFSLANRVIRADYCGDGYPYTYPGNPLKIRDNVSPGQEGTTLADVYASLAPGDRLEAVWDEKGILCIDTPRVDTLGADEVFCPFKMSQLGAQVHWRPPSCDTFVDQTPQLMRFFSITEDD